jgi:hypothetical protein
VYAVQCVGVVGSYILRTQRTARPVRMVLLVRMKNRKCPIRKAYLRFVYLTDTIRTGPLSAFYANKINNTRRSTTHTVDTDNADRTTYGVPPFGGGTPTRPYCVRVPTVTPSHRIKKKQLVKITFIGRSF